MVTASKPTFGPAASTAIRVSNARDSCRPSSERAVSHHERPVRADTVGPGRAMQSVATHGGPTAALASYDADARTRAGHRLAFVRGG